MKTCTKCLQMKPEDRFRNCSRNKDGLSTRCTECIRLYTRERYKAGGEHAKRAAYAAVYRKKFRDNAKQYSENYKKSSPRSSLGQARCRALKRRPSNNPVTVNELMDMFVRHEGRCMISGLKMTWGHAKKASLVSLSIDRIDNSKGYEKENVRLICHGLNALRGGWSDVEMMELATALVEFQASKKDLRRAA